MYMMKRKGFKLIYEYLNAMPGYVTLNGDKDKIMVEAYKYAKLCADRGLHINSSLAAACVFASLRMNGKPVLIRQVAKATGLPMPVIHARYSELLEILGMKPAPMKPLDFLEALAAELELDEDIVSLARRILACAKFPHAPSAAAAAILVAAERLNKQIDENMVVRASNTSRPSIIKKKTLLKSHGVEWCR